MTASGLYQIKNRITGERYIGSSAKLHIRLTEHRRLLKQGRHHSVKLQQAWADHGEGAFDFSVLAYLERCELLPTEQRALDQGNCAYNVAVVAGAPMRGRKMTVEQREAKREATRGTGFKGTPFNWRGKSRGAAYAEKIKAAKSVTSEETRAKMSASAKLRSDRVKDIRSGRFVPKVAN